MATAPTLVQAAAAGVAPTGQCGGEGVRRGARLTTQWRTAERVRAAKQRPGATASGREGKRVGASEVDRQAARCKAGVQG